MIRKSVLIHYKNKPALGLARWATGLRMQLHSVCGRLISRSHCVFTVVRAHTYMNAPAFTHARTHANGCAVDGRDSYLAPIQGRGWISAPPCHVMRNCLQVTLVILELC